jgi:hypothetical protein
MTAMFSGSNTPVFHRLSSISICTLLKQEQPFQTSFRLAQWQQSWEYGLTVGSCVTALFLKTGDMAPKYNSELKCDGNIKMDFLNFNTSTVHLLLLCTNQCTIN